MKNPKINSVIFSTLGSLWRKKLISKRILSVWIGTGASKSGVCSHPPTFCLVIVAKFCVTFATNHQKKLCGVLATANTVTQEKKKHHEKGCVLRLWR